MAIRRISRNVWSHIRLFYHHKIHFLQLHYIYILLLSFISSATFYLQPGTNWNYIDALFMATSATTNTGLNTINMSQLTTWKLIVIYLSSFMGSHVMISIIILYVRRHYFVKRFEDILIFNKAQRLREENRRKFEKNIEEMERQRRRSIGSIDSRKQMHGRLSFMSIRSTTDKKDEEDNQTTIPTSAPRRKSRFSAPQPLSTGLEFLSNFRKKNHNNDNGIESLPYFEEATQSAVEHHQTFDTSFKISYPDQAHDSNYKFVTAENLTESPPSVLTLQSSTVEDNNSYRDNYITNPPNDVDSDAAEHTCLGKVDNNSNKNNNQRYSNGNNNSNPNNSIYLTNTTETILSDASSRNSNSINSFSENKNSHQINAQSTEDLEATPQHIMNTTNEDNLNSSMGAGNQGIAFAENIERQREIARRRLEQDRKYEDILQRIAGDADSISENNHNSDIYNSTRVQSNTLNTDTDDEEMKKIMREPIHKSELTRQQRYRLGGAEYRAIVFLTRLVPIYYIFCSVGLGFVMRIYIAASTYAQEVLRTANTNGPVNEWLFSFFCSMSSFNNLGLVQIDVSLIPFQSAPGLLIPAMFLILAGNTAYAIFLRLIIWIMYKLTPESFIMRKETFRYLLDHPRRCYTTLFPATQTKWLLIVLLGITAVEFIAFLALNYWLPVLESIDWGARVLDGLFQSIATRNAGYSVVNLMALNPGTQIVYIIAMYISVYPVAISMRNSNVYQERALGIYSGQDDEDGEFEQEPDAPNLIHRLKRSATMSSVVTASRKVLRKPDFFVMTQIQRQLTSEICWVICCIFAICVIEAESIMSPSPITISTVIYECVSAFGNVGASTGYPNTSASQAQQYHSLSKFVLIILMYRGRHRGLPAAIDRAVLLPSEQLEEKEHEDYLLRRRNTSLSGGDGSGDPVIFYSRSRTL